MPVIVASHAGFCMGVQQAIEQALQAANQAEEQGLQCYSLGELIHNPAAVSALEARGIRAVQHPEEARDGLLILRSHGVSPDVEEKARQIATQVVDCTCPFVRHLHGAVRDFSAQGAPVILIGDAGHPEVIGTAGWCKGRVWVISTPEEVNALPDEAAEALLVAQTTFPPQRWEQLSQQLLARFPNLTVRRTICSATALRQQEAAELAATVDIMMVVGGKNSANTRKLYETCKQHCPNTYLVECAAEIPPHLRFKPEQRIGVTAGASTPEWSLKEVINTMNDMERMDQATTPETEQAPQAPVAAEETAVEPTAEAQTPAAEPEQEAPQAPEATEETAAEEPAAPEAQAEEAEAPAQEAEAEAEPEAKPAPTFMDQVAASMTRIRSGQTITGKVVQITEDEVCVNIGYKSDGLIKRSELVDEDVELGDDIEVEVVKVNDGDGNVILSQRNIVNRKVWEDIKAKYEAGEFVQGVGKEAVKGGLLATIEGVRAFIPASHLSQRYVEKINQFVGQEMTLKIIELDDSKKRVVASRKEVLAAENAAKKEAVWSNLVEGSVVRGIVRRFASFGAFVDLGGVDGLIHITDLSWNRSAQPQDVLKANQEIDVKILSLDRERERIQLGYKQLQPRPWDNVEEKYPVGEVLTRKVVRIRPFGAFIELEPGVDGLVHISQVSITRIDKVEDVLQPGQEVNVKILGVDPDAKRISLSIREALEESVYESPADIPGEWHEDQSAAPAPQAPRTIEEALAPADDATEETGVAAAFRRAAEAAGLVQEDAPAGDIAEAAQKAADTAEEAVEETADTAEKAVEETADAVEQKAEEAAQKAGEVAEEAAQTVAEGIEAAEEKLEVAAEGEEEPKENA